MKFYKLLATMVIVVAVSSGCTTMNTVMKSWVGNSIDDLTASWGAPESRISRQDGGYTYSWKDPWSNQYGYYECKKTFVTNSKGVIVSYSYAGCPRLVPKF